MRASTSVSHRHQRIAAIWYESRRSERVQRCFCRSPAQAATDDRSDRKLPPARLGELWIKGLMVRVMDRKKDMIHRVGFNRHRIEMEYPRLNMLRCRTAWWWPGHARYWAGERMPLSASSPRAHCAARLLGDKMPESRTVLTAALARHTNGNLLKREKRERVIRLSSVWDKPV